MAASLREALDSAITAEETKDESTADASAVQETSTIEEASSVDISGAPTDKTETQVADAASTVADKTPIDAKSDIADKSAADARAKVAAEDARQHRIDRAPQSWKKESKGEWAALPLHIRQEVHKREAEINRVLAQAAPERQIAEQFKATVQPFMTRMQTNGVDPITAARNLFEADHRLATGHPNDRAQYMAELILEYGIPIEALDAALAPLVNGRQSQSAAPVNGIDPSIQQLIQQQLSQALAPIMQERQQAQQRSQQQVEQTVEQMALDPKYPFFDEVRMDMADLIDLAARKGVALPLDEAYSRAVRMNPDTYSQMERQTTVSSATQAHQAAMRAKNAGSSISGAPAGGGGQFNNGDGSLRGAIEAAFGGQRL